MVFEIVPLSLVLQSCSYLNVLDSLFLLLRSEISDLRSLRGCGRRIRTFITAFRAQRVAIYTIPQDEFQVPCFKFQIDELSGPPNLKPETLNLKLMSGRGTGIQTQNLALIRR